MPSPTAFPYRIQLPSLETLDHLFSLDAEAGTLTWNISICNVKEGSPAGTVNSNGYLQVRTGGIIYLSHRLIWKMYHREEPPVYLDHKNGNTLDNRPDNLRRATQQENMANQKLIARNTSGVKGVSWHTRDKKWRANISHEGRMLHLGYFGSFDDACLAARNARDKFHGEFVNHG